MFARNIYTYLIILVCITNITIADYVQGEVIVRFASKKEGEQITEAEQNKIITNITGKEIHQKNRITRDLTLIKLPENMMVTEAIEILKKTEGVLSVQPNFIYTTMATFPNETESPGRFNEQWGLHNTGQSGGTADADIDAPEAWDIIHNAEDVIVAVIDTGVDYNHPDLTGNMWINEAEYYGEPGVNDDGNCDRAGVPLIDDIYGYDFSTFNGKVRDANPMDDFGHGTHCAGIIGAVGNNGQGITGVCWNVKIMALKWMVPYNDPVLGLISRGNSADAIHCIYYAIDKGAKIMNNSWGGTDYDQELKNAINDARAAGILFITGAGNDGDNIETTPFYPASFDCENIISVMATDHSDGRWYSQWIEYSNIGYISVDLAAPGAFILSCMPGGYYQSMSGTSMAAPFVSGACALVWAANTKQSHLDVKQRILDSIDDTGTLDNLCVTEGRLNVYNAVSLWPLRLTISDNIGDGNSVQPNDIINYTIHYDTYTVSDTGVELTDTLPKEADYLYSDPNGSYNPATNTITWYIGNMGQNSSGTYKIWAKVNGQAIPGYRIINKCKLEGDTFGRKASKKTAVDCYRNYAVFVDADANEGGNGLWWDTAYFTV